MWDCDERSYSYFIEVSNNEKDWEVVWDRSKVACRSWQTITFPRRPIVYIRIVGTYNTANEVFHCVHFECPAISTCTKSLGNNDDIETEGIEGAAAVASASEVSSEDDTTSSTSENAPDNEMSYKRVSQSYKQSISENSLGSIHHRNRPPASISLPEGRALNNSHTGSNMEQSQDSHKGKKRDKKASHRHCNVRVNTYPHQSVHRRKIVQNEGNGENSSAVGAGIASDIPSSRASMITVATVLDDIASTVANAAEQEEEQQQIIQGADDEALDVESVVNGDADLVDNDATETQSQISHHSSPASYAGSISGHSTAGVNANNSLPVGASACSMARQCQQEQFGYKQIQQLTSQQQGPNNQTFNFRVLSQQPPLNDTHSTSNIASASIPGKGTSRLPHHPSPQGSGSPVSSPSSPAPNEQHALGQTNVRFYI